MKIRPVEGAYALYEIIDDNGHSSFDQDAAKFGMSREVKRQLKSVLIQVCQALAIKGEKGLKDFIADDLLKKIDKNYRAKEHNLWEIRDSAHGGRLFFIMDDDGTVIVSAVDKRTKDQEAQDKAINRGLNRWEKILKS